MTEKGNSVYKVIRQRARQLQSFEKSSDSDRHHTLIKRWSSSASLHSPSSRRASQSSAPRTSSVCIYHGRVPNSSSETNKTQMFQSDGWLRIGASGLALNCNRSRFFIGGCYIRRSLLHTEKLFFTQKDWI